MRVRPFLAGFVAVTAMTVGVGFAASVKPDHPSHAERPNGGRSLAEATTAPLVAPPPLHDAPPAVVAEALVSMIGDYMNAVRTQAIGDYLAYQTELDREAYLAALADAAARAHAIIEQPTPPVATSTGACGGATNGADQFIGRESGGDPSAQNPSGAYGCYQIMPGTWAGSCSDLGPEMGASADVQAQCASRLPMSAWAL